MESSEHEPVNIGNPTEMTLLELAQAVVKLTGSKSEIVFEALPVDDRRYASRTSRGHARCSAGSRRSAWKKDSRGCSPRSASSRPRERAMKPRRIRSPLRSARDINRPERPQARTLNEMLSHTVGLYPDSVAYAFNDRTLTFSELEQTIERCAAGLAKLGIGKGDTFGSCCATARSS